MNQIEVEVKSLLGEQAAADRLRKIISVAPYAATLKARSSQLNHYFLPGDGEKLFESVKGYFDAAKQEKLQHILTEGKQHSIRTRTYNDGKALLVLKASIDDTTSSNGVARIEFEEEVPGLDMVALDQLLLGAGFAYQAKWSRDREEYTLAGGTIVCLDRNAGYGYLAEFERMVSTLAEAEVARDEIRALMAELDAPELPQDRLERMFAFYNEHWPEYYGTDKIFSLQ
jgi:adenylate cyclase class IV